ncbi:hypothetical protein [Streptomyces violaceusniger]|uniref:hypothetical protein n=1 Tax=Streptomyces violaceusniger TaxID=68280 RepID=UPI0038302D50
MDGVSCVVAYEGDEPAGFTYGAPRPRTRMVALHRVRAEQRLLLHLRSLRSDGAPRWRKQGLSERLHEALLKKRTEDLVVLLVDVTHSKVQKLYEIWTYTKVGEQQPFVDSPVHAVMIKEFQG